MVDHIRGMPLHRCDWLVDYSQALSDRLVIVFLVTVSADLDPSAWLVHTPVVEGVHRDVIGDDLVSEDAVLIQSNAVARSVFHMVLPMAVASSQRSSHVMVDQLHPLADSE